MRRARSLAPRCSLLLSWALLALAGARRRRTGAAARLPGQVVFGGLEQPTNFRFAPDGRVFVAEKPGQILVYDSLDDTTPKSSPTCAGDVYDNGDRGLLGLALDPEFDEGRPYVYALYTWDHVLGEPWDPADPKWGTPGTKRRPRLPEPERQRRLPGQRPPRPPRQPERRPDHAVEEARRRPKRRTCSKAGASSSPRTRSASSSSAPKGRSTPAAARRLLRIDPRLRPARERRRTPAATRRPGRNGAATPNIRSAGWGAALAEPETAQRRDPPRSTPTPANALPGNPLAATATRTPTDRRQGLPQPVPLHPRPGDRRNLHRQRRLLGDRGDRPLPGAADRALQLRLALLRGDPAPVPVQGTGARRLRTRSTTNPSSNLASRSSPTATNRRSCPKTNARLESGSAISGISFYEGEQFPAKYKGALFFADAVRGCIWVMYPGADGSPILRPPNGSCARARSTPA